MSGPTVASSAQCNSLSVKSSISTPRVNPSSGSTLYLASSNVYTDGSLFRAPNITCTAAFTASGGPITISGIGAYDDDAAAGAAGVATGELYQTTGAGLAPLNAAGILMIKQ